jgi:hypothetical protein
MLADGTALLSSQILSRTWFYVDGLCNARRLCLAIRVAETPLSNRRCKESTTRAPRPPPPFYFTFFYRYFVFVILCWWSVVVGVGEIQPQHLKPLRAM